MALICLLFAIPCRAGEDDSAAALTALLGEDLATAKIVAIHDDTKVATVDLSTLELKVLGSYERKGRFESLDRPYWSPDGGQIVFAYDRKAFLMNADGTRERQILRNEPSVYDARFWQDPATGDLCIYYIDKKAKNSLERGKWGNSMLAILRTAETKALFDLPCDAGLSKDGTHLGETYRDTAIVDLTTEKIYEPHDGQSCNSSMSPDNTYRMMFLYLPHTHFGIKDKYGREHWRIRIPKGSQEWQGPRWSNHPDFCSAVAKFKDGYKPVIIQISTKKMVILRELEGNWHQPQLWLASAVEGTDVGPLQKISSLEEAGEQFIKAAEMPDARQAKAIYMEIAEKFKGEPIAAEAETILNSPAFTQELAARPALDQLWALTDRLHPVAGAESRSDDPAYFKRNRVLLLRMAHLVRDLRRNYPASKTYGHAVNIAEQYALPEEPGELVHEEVELLATIEAVSRVPTAEQIAPYENAVTFIRYRVNRVIAGSYESSHIVVVHWGMKERKHTPAARWRPGMRLRLKVDLFDAHPELDRITQASGANDASLEPYWALEIREKD